MKSIKYKLEFFSEWHCGSGLSKGADVDALVVKNSQGLPFVPGKTIKGLLREQVAMLIDLRGKGKDMEVHFNETFGIFKSQEGTMFCSKQEQSCILSEELATFLYRSLSFAAINDDGVADNHSLRKIEAVVPCTLEGTIDGISDDLYDFVKDGLALIKRMGTHRSRGLGRCKFTII